MARAEQRDWGCVTPQNPEHVFSCCWDVQHRGMLLNGGAGLSKPGAQEEVTILCNVLVKGLTSGRL